MGLKSTLKLFLLFCSLNLILNLESFTLGPDSPVTIDSQQATQYSINTEGELKNFITIKFSYEEDTVAATDPVFIVGRDEYCRNRITMTDQKVGPIYIFLKKSQVKDSNPFYICTYNRNSTSELNKHTIKITTDEKAELPLNQQTSFYVDAQNTKMNITFLLEDKNPNYLTFWARGKNIQYDETLMNNYQDFKIDGGKIFYGSHKVVAHEMTIVSGIGDYITVGSASITSNKIVDQNLVINGNEITIAVDNLEEVCFPVDYDEKKFSAITGKLYTLKGTTSFKDKKNQPVKIEGQECKTEVIDGIISDYNDIRKQSETEEGYYCIASDNTIVFTIQMVSFGDYIIVTPPTLPGDIRRYIMKKGETAIFSAMTPTDGAQKLNFNMKSLKGFPDLYFHEDDYFPIIRYTDDKFKNKKHPLISNRFATYIYHLQEKPEKTTYLSPNQPIILIHCTEGSSSKFSKNSKFCEIEVSIFTNQDTVTLAETRQFSQFLDEGEANNYKIMFPQDFKFNSKIFIELTPFTGDAEININNYQSGSVNNYYLSNKVFCNISYDKNKIDFVEFNVKAKKKVFYTVDYYMIYYNKLNEDKKSLESGINYITSKDAYDSNKQKYVYLKNFKYEDKHPYMASFYSPNCELSVTLDLDGHTQEIQQYDTYAHIIMDLNHNEEYCRENYFFTYNIEKYDGSNYPNKFCMVYVAGLELDYDKEWEGRSISLSEGVPHIFPYTPSSVFSHYSYYVLNRDNSVVINFNLIDKAHYKVYIRIERDDYKEYDLYKNQQISINSGILDGRCSRFEICKLDIIVEAQDVSEKEEKKVEISVYQLDPNPIYLEKNRVKNDFINGNAVKHYYFDISQKECGDITLDFKRGSGNIYAIIEPRKNDSSIVVDADWRGVYKFPDENTVGTLEYRTYGKKLLISEYNTSICNEGCYVLITVKSNRQIPSPADDTKYPFRISLNPRVIPIDLEKDNPIVKISLNEFVVGDIFWANTENRKYDFYQVELTHDSNEVHIDFQSDTSYLLVNVGKNNPPRLNEMPDWFFPPVGDFVYRLGRAEMLYHAGRQQTDTLKGIILTIGIYANVTDSIKSTPYAFKVFEPPFTPHDNEKIASELIHVTSDQKVQCLPLLFETRYPLCLFVILLDDIELKKNLILLPRSQNNKPFEKYGRKVSAFTIETFDIKGILDLTKNTYENADKYQIKEDFIFEENLNKDEAYFLIISTDDRDGIIDLLSSTYAFEKGDTFRPNPSTPQIFALQDKNINILFQTHQDLLLNINSVNGIGFFNWVEEVEEKQRKFYLKGRNDRLSLTSGKGESPDPLPKLQATSRTETILMESKAGFVFYITYYPRSYMDQLKPNTMGEIHYRTVNMPLSFFARVRYMQPWIVNLNFYDIIPKKGDSLEYDSALFDIWGTVLSENEIYKARNDENLRPNPPEEKKIEGKFDAFYGVIFFSEDDILRLIDNSTGIVPYIYFNIDNNIEVEYETIGLEADVHSIDLNGESAVPEGVYITGKLKSATEGKKIYRINVNKNKPFIRIEYSTNSVYVKFALSADSSSETTDNFEMKTITEASGRNILTVKLSEQNLKEYKFLYFVAFSEAIVDGLDYFVFKYLTAKYESEYLEIKDITKDKIKVEEIIDDRAKSKKLKVTLTPVPYNDTTYLIKAIYTDNYKRGENLESIAMSESKGKNLLVNVHIHEGKNKTFEFDAQYEKDILYVKVMAMFNFVEEKIIYLYKPYDVSEGRTAPSIKLKRTPDIQNITLLSKFRIIAGEIEEDTAALKKQKYQVIFEHPELALEYVKVEVTNINYLGEPPESPTVCISTEDQDCMYHRNQLSKGGSTSTEIFIKKEQFHDHFFFTVECHDSVQNCSYKVNISKQHEVTFDHLGIINYYVSELDRNMVFKFNNKNNDETGIISVYATGGKDVDLSFVNCNDDYDCSQHLFDYGAGITANMTSKLDYFLIRVSASTGDYISLGVKFFKQNENENDQFKLYQKNGQITGILRKDILKEECYDLPEEVDTYYLTGRIYDNSSMIRFTDSDKSEEYHLDLHKLENGFFYAILKTTNEATHLCFNMSADHDYSAYSIQIQSLSKFDGAVFLPQNTPLSYPRIIPKGKVITLNSILPKANSKYLVYNMIARLGYPKMYIYECDTYPSCPVDDTDIEANQKIKGISDINGMSSYFTSDALHKPIDAEQKLLVFRCKDAIGKGKYGYEYCEILSTIFGDNEPVKLIEKQPFGRFNTPEDTNQYLIDLSSAKENWFKVNIEFLVVSGDVNIDIKNADTYGDITNNKYYLSNKIFYSITVDKNNEINKNLEKILIDTNSKINSYYLVEYKLITVQKEELYTNYVKAGINYLVPFEENTIKKAIDIESIKIIQPKIFIASFFSLNCKFEIEKINNDGSREKIGSIGRYAQDFYQYQETDAVNTKHSYFVNIIDKQSLYKKHMCMLYVSGVESYEDDSGVRKEILVSEGVPQRMIFSEPIKRVRYVFPHAQPNQNLTCSINMIVPGKIKVKTFFREKEFNIDKVVTQSEIFYIYSEWIQTYCEENYERCSITVELELEKVFNDEPPIVEFSIKNEKNTPYYFPKAIQRKEYITNDAYLFLYTDVGKDDSGYVTIDFDRGSGFAYGKLVQINQEGEDKNADWRKYRFIRFKDENSLDYDYYNKKIRFKTGDTAECDNGCFLLISVVSSIIRSDSPKYDFQSFTILAAFNPETDYSKDRQTKIGVIPDEFVVGSLYKSDSPDKYYKEKYSLICPYEAEAIEIDFQTNIVKLNVEIGGKEFEYSNNGHSLYTITKGEIVDSGESLKNKELILKVSTTKFDPFDFAVYSFRVHLKRNNEINIHKVTSDKKIVCTPTLVEGTNTYRCLYIVTYKEKEVFNDLMIYPKSQDPSALINTYADYIQGEIYDSYNIDLLRDKIPADGTARFNTKERKTNFLFVQKGDFNSHVLVSVISDNDQDIELLTSFKTFEVLIEPNPRSPQVYAIDLSREDIHINFVTKESLSVDIMSLHGESRYSFDHDEDISFYLRGEGDKLNYAIKTEEGRHNTALNVENIRHNDLNYEEPGCAFVLEFSLRSSLVELDSIKIGETKEMVYKDLPFNKDVYYYAKITDPDKDVAGFFYLHDLEYEEQSSESRLIYSGEILFKAMVVTEKRINDIIGGHDKIPEDFYYEGIYDATLKAGSIQIDKNNFTNIEDPVLLVTIRKDEKSNLGFKRFRGEIGFNYVNGEAPITQKLYQFGKIVNPEEVISYKLKTDSKKSHYVRVQFSGNSEYVDFTISQEKGVKNNATFNDTTIKRQRGITFVTFKRPEDAEFLYLNVFLNDSLGHKKLNNYVFKYINALEKESFKEFKIMYNNPRINVQNINGTIKVLFSPIDYVPNPEEKIDTTILYSVKLAANNTYVQGERTDLIAITESPSVAKQYKHISTDNRTVEIISDIGDNTYKYAQIIAAITHGSFIEYVTYQAVDDEGNVIEPESNPEPGEDPDDTSKESDDNTDTTTDGQRTDKPAPAPAPATDKNKKALIAIIVVSCFLFVVVVVLVVVIVMYNSKNKDLLTQVNKISFVQSGASAKDDANLLLDNQNELD